MGKELFSELEKGPKADLEKCHELVQKGADLRFIGAASNHALILAILYNHDDLALSMLQKDPAIANLPGSNENVPVMFAIYRNDKDLGEDRYLGMIDTFAKAGADFLAENFVGTTPLKAAELRDAHRPTLSSAKALERVTAVAESQKKLAEKKTDKKHASGNPSPKPEVT